MSQLTRRILRLLLEQALREDRAAHDVTSRTVLPAAMRIRARLIAKAPGVLAGGPAAAWAFLAVDQSLGCVLRRQDGARVAKGDTILTVKGRARSIFAAERTALNFLAHLSGIATLTAQYVQRVRPYHAKIYDTRKTLPGLRTLEKYAVRAGGGRNHRADLSEAILVKTNHLRVMQHTVGTRTRVIKEAIRLARRSQLHKAIEIEVRNLREFQAALEAGAAVIMLDNWSLKEIRKAVSMRNKEREKLYTFFRKIIMKHRPDQAWSKIDEHIARALAHDMCLLEVSGGVTLANVRAIAKTGVDRISVGRLTHSAPSLDVALEVV